jgi:hypothetical protein
VSAETIARALGTSYRSASGWWNARCPVCGGDKLGLRDGDHGLIVHCFRGCPRTEIIAEIKDLDLADNDDDPAPLPHNNEPWRRRQQLAEALDIWRSATPPAPTGIVAKFVARRGLGSIKIPPTIRELGIANCYSWHPMARERRPVMVAPVSDINRKITGVTRTYLSVDGRKAAFDKPRLFTGQIRGGAVRLGPMTPGQPLLVGEGIETTLSAMRIYGYSAGWAALSAYFLPHLVLPPEVGSILLVVDNDANGVGQAAAREAAWIWQQEGRAVRIALPPAPEVDFNDILRSAI